MIGRIVILYLIIVTGDETMVCPVCLSMFLGSHKTIKQNLIYLLTDICVTKPNVSFLLTAQCGLVKENDGLVKLHMLTASLNKSNQFWINQIKSCIQQRKTTCLLSIWISLACARASKLTTDMFTASLNKTLFCKYSQHLVNYIQNMVHCQVTNMSTTLCFLTWHYNDVIMSGASIVCSTVGSGGVQRKHQSSGSLAFVRGINQRPVTRKMFPFDDVINTWFPQRHADNDDMETVPAILPLCKEIRRWRSFWTNSGAFGDIKSQL